jgi:uncharacterized membrane protein
MVYADDDFHDALTLYLVATGILYTFFAYPLHCPTKQGARPLADIEGFRMYMKTAEQHRLNLLNPPEQTPEHFEKMLPYAMALGVANHWCKKFASVLSIANYQPSWSDDTFDERSWYTFNDSFNRPFSNSVDSYSKKESSSDSSGSSDWSSGSSGGGSSGSGGGGGSTSGW